MFTLAAYSLEVVLDSEAAKARVARVQDEVTNWLRSKGVPDADEKEGFFNSLSGDEGTFSRHHATSSSGEIFEVQLDEVTNRGDTFTTNIQVASDGKRVAVFTSLGISSGGRAVAPVQIYPRCPQVVRTLIETFDDWTFGGQLVPRSIPADTRGARGGQELADELRNPARNFPIVVISADADEMVWGSLPAEMARELVGLAQVAVVDEEASWTLTSELGKPQSCFLGAARLYWPLSNGKAALRSILWTASRQEGYGADQNGMRHFLAAMRRTVMSVASLNIVQPDVVRTVHTAITRERLSGLEAAARDKELDALIEENSRLAAALKDAEGELASLRWKILHLQDRLHDAGEGEQALEEDHDQSAEESKPPVKGEIRYYKKIGNKGGVDDLVQTAACNHNAWRFAFKGDQAEKGLQKLEGRSDWRSLAHCGTCTGGGRWKVHW